MFTEDGPVDMRAVHTMLSAWHLRGRYMPPKRSPMVFVFAAITWLIRFVVGVPLSVAVGRSPASMLQAPTIPPVPPLKLSGPLPRRQLPEFAGA
ncbi:MAG TPA: hypothetical protein VLI06_17815 [Solimonas sp.]|nr:hypothetical protein [Solimonas sp.]